MHQNNGLLVVGAEYSLETGAVDFFDGVPEAGKSAIGRSYHDGATRMIWIWTGFIAFVLLMLALDLGIFHRKAHVVSEPPRDCRRLPIVRGWEYDKSEAVFT